MQNHVCDNVNNYDIHELLQIGKGKFTSILVIGESPAMDGWILSKKAFYRLNGTIVPSGKRLNELLKLIGTSVEECSFTEICKCFLDNDRKTLFKCGINCFDILLKQIDLVNPKIIITLGVETLRILNTCIEEKLNIGEFREANFKGRKICILPIYHPSPINPKSREKNLEIFEKNTSSILKIMSIGY